MYLRENDPEVSIKFTIDDLNNIENKIKKTAEGIKSGEFSGSKGMHCERCDYRELICPLFG